MQQTPATDNAVFMEIVREHDALIHKVCFMYAEDREHLRDLYQEVLANIWSGLKGYSGRAKMSTWIYRISLNTCITYFRRHGKHSGMLSIDDAVCNIPDEDQERDALLKWMYELIGGLEKIDKAIVMLWLDEHSYDEISEITGISRPNVASRLHRIRKRLAQQAQEI